MSEQLHGNQSDRKREIDWTEIHRRLETVSATLASDWNPTPEKSKEILRLRARALAREPKTEEPPDQSLEIVEFLLAYERYGVETLFIREVYPLKELTPLPGTPPFVLGIINVRGKMLSVLDLKKFFDLPEKGLTDLNKVIVLHSGIMEFGILADAILGVKTIPSGSLQPALPTLTGIREEYLKGLTPDRAVILAAEKLLADRRIVVHQEQEG